MMKSDPLRVLHVTFNMDIGGTEQVIRQIVCNSDVDSFHHEVLCVDGRIGPMGQRLVELGYKVHKIERKPGLDYALVREIRKLVGARSIDVLHCHQYTPYFYGVLASINSAVALIFTEHGRFYPDRHHFKRRFINPLLALRTQYFSAISKATADAVAKYEYMPRKRIRVVYNGIVDIAPPRTDTASLAAELGFAKGNRFIGTVSRLQPIKNQAMMIRAFGRVRQQLPELKLLIIGDGAKMDELRALSESLGLQQDVHFTGFIDNPQRYIDLFEVFLLSSFSEGTSMTLLEAMSLSKPCVVTDVGGNPEIVVDQQTGLTVPSNDEAGFARSILQLLTDEKLRKSMGEAGRQRFLERFSVDKMLDDYQAMYAGNVHA